ncbi:hypothetical protein TDB9533_04256 [Thalassocella blandensis]|nr:hypothetical protein TDB9533_04256 [Thalassocella blandensis]
MIKINADDLEIANLRKLKFSVNIKSKPEHGWSAVYKNLGLQEAFYKLENMENEKNTYHDRGVFVETKAGEFKYWSTSCKDLFNSVVLLA